MGNLYVYIRVNTREQNEDRQILALKELSIPEKNMLQKLKKTICSISKASTVWGVTILRF